MIDVEAGGLVPEAEAERNAARLHVDDRVAPGEADQRRQRNDQQGLVEEPAHPGVIDSRPRHDVSRQVPAPGPHGGRRWIIASAVPARKGMEGRRDFQNETPP